eukprot:1052902-Prymnesium_polylepis.1
MPLIGTLLFQSVVGQATTLMVAKLGTLAIAASAAVNAATQIASQAGPIELALGLVLSWALSWARPFSRAARCGTPLPKPSRPVPASQGFAAAFTAVAAVRVGFHLGRDDVTDAPHQPTPYPACAKPLPYPACAKPLPCGACV